MSESIFKKGMKVMVRPDLEYPARYPSFDNKSDMDTTIEMKNMAGKIVTFSHISSDGNKHKIKEDSNYYNWSDTMFIPLDEETLFDLLIRCTISEKEYERYLICLK